MEEEIKAIDIQTEPVNTMVCSDCQTNIDVADIESFSEIECPSCGAHLTVPAKLGPFHLIRLIGTGGHDEVALIGSATLDWSQALSMAPLVVALGMVGAVGGAYWYRCGRFSQSSLGQRWKTLAGVSPSVMNS